MDWTEFLADIQNTHLTSTILIGPPYEENHSIEEKFRLTYSALRRTIQLKQRTLSLVNAYYLGQLLINFESHKDRYRYKQKLSPHYATIAEYVYDIFEPKPNQIMEVQLLSVQEVRRLKRSQVLALREKLELMVFAGTQTLEEEVVSE